MHGEDSAKIDFTSVIDKDGTITCELVSRLEYTVAEPVLCFSLLAPATAIDNCRVVDNTGGFTRLALNRSLEPGISLSFVIDYQSPDFKAANRAWLPLGCYLLNDNAQVLEVHGVTGGVSQHIDRVTVNSIAMPGQFAVVPKPSHLRFSGGTQTISTLNISAAPEFRAAVTYIEALISRSGFESLISDNGTVSGVRSDLSLSPESYEIEVSTSTIAIAVSDEAGLFYALVTLLTMRESGGGVIPVSKIEDTPRFCWRGQHLDCARHFYEVDTILRLLDLMAMLKLNRFHWHFSDDEAFRLQSDFASSLWQDTAYRGEGQLLPGLFGGGAGPTGGSYSKADVAKIIAHAKSLYIEVMPEIEYPAHALCVNRRFPYLRDKQDNGVEQSVQGYQHNVVNPAVPDTQAFFEKLCLEVGDLFPFSHIHLGGDELPDDSWNGSPMMDSFKSKHQLVTKEDVQGYAMHELAVKVRANNLVPCAWEESGRGAGGGIQNDAILFLWQGVQKFEQLASMGYRCVLSPAQHTYFDMAHTSDKSDWGANWAATVSLADTVNWEPVPDNLERYADKCLGVQGAFWSEFTTRDKEMEAMIAPRILGVACKAWCKKGAVSREEILSLARSYEVIFRKLDWQCAPAGLYS